MLRLSHPRKLAPIEAGPFFQYRHIINKKLLEVAKPGQILLRRGNATLYSVVDFSKIICDVTGSLYSHAAMILYVDYETGDICVGDVDALGCQRQFLPDWLSAVRGDQFALYEYDDLLEYDVDNILDVAYDVHRNVDPEFDEQFSDENFSFYCVEYVQHCYKQGAGIDLCEAVSINKMPGWRSWMTLFCKLHGLNPSLEVFCVGNESIGMLSNKNLKEVCTVKLKRLRKQNGTALLRGA